MTFSSANSIFFKQKYLLQLSQSSFSNNNCNANILTFNSHFLRTHQESWITPRPTLRRHQERLQQLCGRHGHDWHDGGGLIDHLLAGGVDNVIAGGVRTGGLVHNTQSRICAWKWQIHPPKFWNWISYSGVNILRKIQKGNPTYGYGICTLDFWNPRVDQECHPQLHYQR